MCLVLDWYNLGMGGGITSGPYQAGIGLRLV
jgi:hypothetical protein